MRFVYAPVSVTYRVDDPARFELVALGLGRVVRHRVLRVEVDALLLEVVERQVQPVVEQLRLDADFLQLGIADRIAVGAGCAVGIWPPWPRISVDCSA